PQLDNATLAKIAADPKNAPRATRIAGLTKAIDDQVLTAALRGRQGVGVAAKLNPLRLPSWMNRGYVAMVASDESDFVASTFLRYVHRKAGALVDEGGRINQRTLASALGGYGDEDFAAL